MTVQDLTYPRVARLALGQGYSWWTPSVIANYNQPSTKIIVTGIWPSYNATFDQLKQLLLSLKQNGAKVVNYMIQNESPNLGVNAAGDDIAQKLTDQSWWLLNSAGQQLSWSNGFQAWEANYTRYTTPDGNGDRLPQWLAKRWKTKVWSPGGVDLPWDGVEVDNQFHKGRIAYFNPNGTTGSTYSAGTGTQITGDWLKDGSFRDGSKDPIVARAIRQGNADLVAAVRAARPDFSVIFGNTDHDSNYEEYRKLFDCGMMESVIGSAGSSLYQQKGGMAVMQQMISMQKRHRKPELNIITAIDTSFAWSRLGLAMVLQQDACFGVATPNYALDEFALSLGTAVDAPQYTNKSQFPSGVLVREFSNGLAVANLSGGSVTIQLPAGRFRAFRGTQDPTVNDGQIKNQLTLGQNNGQILVRA